MFTSFHYGRSLVEGNQQGFGPAAAVAVGLWLVAALAAAAEFPAFEYHEIDKIGDRMGQTSLVDVDMM